MKKLLFVVLGVLAFAIMASAQPRQTDRSAAPEMLSVEAKYDGGIFGSTGREEGTLKIDETAARLVFYRKKDQREMFSIPFEALVVVYPDSKEAVSHTGNVVSRLPLPGAGMAGLLSTRAQYMIINFEDPDIDTRGTANFKFDNKKALLAFINTLGTKAKLKQRGDAYYRPRNGGNDF